ncbi:MAG: hypothetical protein DYG89_43615 [Caldilinea sp. CFX5]|nr:hypothetical protein [Caldilinea sp. CFX5]
MNIVMLGHSGVGKTTYMASMYGRLQRPINGFSLQAKDRKNHHRLLETHADVTRKCWPAATDQRNAYEFRLLFKQEEVLPFTWTDYRGGALLERTDGQQTRELLSDLKQADGIIVFCDAEMMVQKRAHRETARMIQLVIRAVKEVEYPIGLAVVFTKYDLVNQEKEMSHLIEPVNPLIESVQASQLVNGSYMPVACGLNAMNVELPVLYVLQMGILLRAFVLQKMIEERLERMQAYEAHNTFFRNLGRMLCGETTYSQMAAQEAQQAYALYSIYEPLIEPAKQLNTYLDDLVKF